jgi:uncharacterized protein YggT (Ycf19 family)
MSWFPQFNLFRDPWKSIYNCTEPFLQLFTGLLPRPFGLELGSLLSFIGIQYAILFLEYLGKN